MSVSRRQRGSGQVGAAVRLTAPVPLLKHGGALWEPHKGITAGAAPSPHRRSRFPAGGWGASLRAAMLYIAMVARDGLAALPGLRPSCWGGLWCGI